MTVIAAVGIIVPLLVGVFAYFAKAWIVPRRRTCSPTGTHTVRSGRLRIVSVNRPNASGPEISATT